MARLFHICLMFHSIQIGILNCKHTKFNKKLYKLGISPQQVYHKENPTYTSVTHTTQITFLK
jgi:hypothetical protein